MPHVEKSSYPSEPDSSEPQLKKLRPNDYVPWRAHDTSRHKEHCTTPPHDNNFPPIPGKYSFEHKYGRDGSISSEYPRTATDRLAPKSAEKFDSDWRAYSRPSAERPEGISPHTSGRASSSEDGYQVSCSVSTSGSEFSLTSTAFIGPLCPPPRTEKVPRSSHVKDRPIARTTSNCCKISTVELGKGPGRSKGNDGMDYELRQFYMELHQLEEENENTPVKTNEHHSSNAVQERPCSSDPPKSITVCSQEVYGVIPHPNHAPFSRREEHIPNNANNLPFINPAMPPRFSGPLARPLTLSHGHLSQNGAIKNIEYKFSDVVQGPFCTQRPSNCVSPHPQSFNAETVWREHNPSDRANNPPYTNNTVPPWFHGPPPAVYHSKSNFPSPDIKPYETYPEKPNRYGCTEEYRRQDDRQQWNELPPPPQSMYNDPGDGFRKTFYDDESVSKHIDLRGESTPRPRGTLLPHTPGTSGEQHVDVNKNSSHKPCDQYRRTLILLRGVPGSGKSTLARVLLDLCPDGLAFSTDDYFSQQEGYVYNVTLLGDAHNWNQNRAKRAMDDGRYPIIIDNTNIQGWEMKPYVQMAIERDYVVEFLEPDTWWKLNPLELEKRNKHGVPRNTISKMLDRYEHYMTVPHVMNSVEPPRLSSSRRAPHPRQQWGNSVDSLQQQTIFHNR